MFLIYNEKQKQPLVGDGIEQRKTLAYLFYHFPRYTETYAYREVLQLDKLGVNMALFALRRDPPGPVPNEAVQLLEKTHYLQLVPFIRKVMHHAAMLIRHPFRYFGVLFKLMLWSGDVPLWFWRNWHTFWVGVILARKLQQKGLNHLHIHHAQKAASVGYVASQIARIPFSIMLYGKDLLSLKRDSRYAIRHARWVFCFHETHKETLLDLVPGLGKEQVRVLHPGVDANVFQPVSDKKESLFQFRLITVTQLEPNRGLEDLLKTYKILDSRDIDFEAIIIGEGPERRKLQDQANRLRLNHRVRFTGARRMEEIIESMGRADLFVLPLPKTRENDYEGIPMALLEAMAMGIPVITTEIEGIRDVVDESTGRVLKEPTPIELADVVEELLLKETLRERLGRRARRRIEKQYHLQETSLQLVQMLGVEYEELKKSRY